MPKGTAWIGYIPCSICLDTKMKSITIYLSLLLSTLPSRNVCYFFDASILLNPFKNLVRECFKNIWFKILKEVITQISIQKSILQNFPIPILCFLGIKVLISQNRVQCTCDESLDMCSFYFLIRSSFKMLLVNWCCHRLRPQVRSCNS